MKKIKEYGLLAIASILILYLAISSMYFSFSQPELTQTQVLLKSLTFGGYK